MNTFLLRTASIDKKDLLKYVAPQDLKSYGLIPEIIGRLPVLFALNPLDKNMLIQILQEPKNAILKQYKKLLAMDEVKLEFEPEALQTIAQRAKEKKVGARALRAIIEEFMLDIMYEIPSNEKIQKVTINKDCVTDKALPKVSVSEKRKTING